jgi:hypothetical protein
MNEQLIKLAEQAGMTDDKFGMFFAKDKHEYGVDLEKFAELIVRECAELSTGYTGNVKLLICNHFGMEP